MSSTAVRPDILYAWKGASVLIVNPRGECGGGLTGFYHREARFLDALRLEIDGRAPWLCESTSVAPDRLAFTFNHPELTEMGGGGSGQSNDAETTDDRGIPHRSLVLRVGYVITPGGLEIVLDVGNHARTRVACDISWIVGADFADIQEANAGSRQQTADVGVEADSQSLTLSYRHPKIPYRTRIEWSGGPMWTFAESKLTVHVELDAQQRTTSELRVIPCDVDGSVAVPDADVRERHADRWQTAFTRFVAPRAGEAQPILEANVRDLASFAHLEGPKDEWLSLQAGMPLYPAFFGRDSLTAGWQAACVDRGQSLDATLTRLGRLQSDRIDDWRDEQPGRIPYQVRSGPLARLNLNPYSAYYADYASPMMFVIALANLFAWTGDKALLQKHWDAARRILEWARTYGDSDRDGYLEYLTRSTGGTKNQGWKDSGDAVIYDDGRAVPAPIATCELQGYWYAAQQLMAVMSWVMGARADAKAFWRSAADLKARFNRDWWVDDERCVAFALDPDKRQVRAVTSNAGHCIACGIVSREHLPPLVGRLFAPDMFSGWGIRTLSSSHAFYNPLSYHRGSIWAVEQASIAFGLKRFGFDTRAAEIAGALFDLARLYPEYRVPECVGGCPRGESATPGAYPRANTPQLWNATAFAMLVHTLLGLQPVAPLDTLVIDPSLPTWLPEVILDGLRVGGATVTLRCWRDRHGVSHGELLEKRGTLHLVKQPPPESLSAGLADRAAALVDSITH
jgi:glycogen debranching enzyme